MDKRENLRPWRKGESGNPGGRPKRDMAAELARAVFEKDPAALGEAILTGSRKGNSGMARMFQVLSDRGYGKLTEHIAMDATVAFRVAERLQQARHRLNALPPEEPKEQLPKEPQTGGPVVVPLIARSLKVWSAC